MKRVSLPTEPLEPVRLLAGGGSDRERRLLEAAAGDAMPPGTPERLERALGNWAAMPSAERRGPVTGAAGARLVRMIIVGGLGGLGLVGWILAPDGGTLEATAAPDTSVVIVAAPQPVAASAEHERVVLASEAAAPPRVSVEPKREARARPARSRNGSAQRSGSRGNLLEEARRLDAVRTALQAKDVPAARRELLDYRERFANGELALEADVLEADLLLAAGQGPQARARATALLERPAAGRYRARLEQLVQRVNTAARTPSVTSGAAGSNVAAGNMDGWR